MKRLVFLSAVIAALGTFAHADMLVGNDSMDLEMEFYDQLGQTAMWRAEVDPEDLGTISQVRVSDLGRGGGSHGVFSGFDIDLLVFDLDGDPTTRYDQIKPIMGSGTYVETGAVRSQGDSPYAYEPTAARPGKLFGLDADGEIDHGLATLGMMDAQYINDRRFGPDSSSGFVTLGDSGSLVADFQLFSLGLGKKAHLLLGDAGMSDEKLAAAVSIEFLTHPVVADPSGEGGGSISLGEGDSVFLRPAGGGDSPVGIGPSGWRWDIDDDGEYDDAVGSELGLSFAKLTSKFGLVVGETHAIRYRSTTGSSGSMMLTLIPEPATLALLGLGGLAALRRRR